jgi:hypothetical protein
MQLWSDFRDGFDSHLETLDRRGRWRTRNASPTLVATT